MRDRIRVRRFGCRMETTYLAWVRRFICFHSGRHPQKLDGPDVQTYLNHLAVDRNVSASTQNQALSAILFLYSQGVTSLGGEPFAQASALAEVGRPLQRQLLSVVVFGPTRRGKDVRIKATADRHALPLAVTAHAANHHRSKVAPGHGPGGECAAL